MEDVLLGLGNPLLDISAHVKREVLEKYELKAGSAILAEPKHVPLYDELVQNYDVQYIAGGATQNSIRAAQWLLQVPKATHYIGCVGNDKFGKALKEAAEKEGVTTHYLVDEKVATGTCAVLVEEKERSLVANLAAANEYKKDKHFDTKEIQDLVAKVKFFYSAGFFLTVSPETVIEVGKHCATHEGKRFLANLSAPFLVDFFWDGKMSESLKYADVVFGNEDEAAAIGKKLGWGEDLEEVAKKLAAYPKVNEAVKRTVIFTQGAKQTLVCQDGQVQKFSPIPCKPEELVDTNGAGDSFVGGFLAGYVQGKPIEECIRAAHYVALECIKQSGCTLPAKRDFTFQ